MNKKFIKGILFVAIGASSYGMLATFVKLGSEDGFSTAELTFSQGIVGVVALFLLNLFSTGTKRTEATTKKPGIKDKSKLMIGGISLGLTSSFYYLSLEYASVSVCIVMLMQSVWMGSVIDFIAYKKKPSTSKILAICFILIGTVLTTNLLTSDIQLDWKGVFWGLLAALSYTLSLWSSNNITVGYPSITRSFYLILGAGITVTLIWGYSLMQQFDISVLWKWGIVLAFFGTVLPPILFTRGMPIIGIALGSIVASVELPISVLFAYFVLSESVNIYQWMGIALILFAVVVMNISLLKPTKNEQ